MTYFPCQKHPVPWIYSKNSSPFYTFLSCLTLIHETPVSPLFGIRSGSRIRRRGLKLTRLVFARMRQDRLHLSGVVWHPGDYFDTARADMLDVVEPVTTKRYYSRKDPAAQTTCYRGHAEKTQDVCWSVYIISLEHIPSSGDVDLRRLAAWLVTDCCLLPSVTMWTVYKVRLLIQILKSDHVVLWSTGLLAVGPRSLSSVVDVVRTVPGLVGQAHVRRRRLVGDHSVWDFYRRVSWQWGESVIL